MTTCGSGCQREIPTLIESYSKRILDLNGIVQYAKKMVHINVLIVLPDLSSAYPAVGNNIVGTHCIRSSNGLVIIFRKPG
jgi:hypothetical protein